MRKRNSDISIAALDPISDAAAAARVSPETLRELAAAVMEMPVPEKRRAPRSFLARRSPVLTLAAGATATAGILVLAGLLAGHGLSTAQPADAEILRGADRALHPAGSLVIESISAFTPCRDAASRICHIERQADGRYIGVTQVTHGALGTAVALAMPGLRPGAELATSATGCQLYDPSTRTVYQSAAYDHDITPGPTPGHYTYRMPPQQTLLRDRCPAYQGPGVPWDVPVPAMSLVITAGQAQALLHGRARIDVVESGHGPYHLRIAPPSRIPVLDAAGQARAQLGALRVAGPTVVAGRRAIKLVPIHGRGEYDVAPSTYYPLRQVDANDRTTTWQSYRVLPDDRQNEARLDLITRHPRARVDQSNADFNAAWQRVTYGD